MLNKGIARIKKDIPKKCAKDSRAPNEKGVIIRDYNPFSVSPLLKAERPRRLRRWIRLHLGDLKLILVGRPVSGDRGWVVICPFRKLSPMVG